jgi:hypothetical protein
MMAGGTSVQAMLELWTWNRGIFLSGPEPYTRRCFINGACYGMNQRICRGIKRDLTDLP